MYKKEVTTDFWNGCYEKIPMGWRKAFGKKLKQDLKNLIQTDSLKNFKITHVSRRYGKLIMLYENGNPHVDYLLSKYANMSMGYCLHCGKPARYQYQNLYVCRDCFKRKHLDTEPDFKNKRILIHTHKLTSKDLPDNSYDVDLSDLWGLRKRSAFRDETVLGYNK